MTKSKHCKWSYMKPNRNSFIRFKYRRKNFTPNFIVHTKLKQYLILGLDFAQRYKIGIERDINTKLFLRCKGKKEASSLKNE